jgi:hypothetical protein
MSCTRASWVKRSDGCVVDNGGGVDGDEGLHTPLSPICNLHLRSKPVS